ncbi:hypothetical protein T03_11147 [Trichinella britovi]|uniref:Uncharacterized protein n=1 Tax=Trichinella britovi TaxID=45882 RepID=A0A0V1C3H3_TRIBR|nr:hypothetical protein T03_17560 [Trichinella britovi]KRY43751.1 hypothetical protein T03_11147 [Trichinella britovi]
MLHMATTCHMECSLCKSAQTTTSTSSRIRTKGRFYCQVE